MSVASDLFVVKRYGEMDWQGMRPIIERLYIRELRPLARVMQIMDSNYQFKASSAMYKRKLRAWGIYKNNRCRPIPTTKKDLQESGTPRYLPQNDVDESLHSLLYLYSPWLAQADIIWNSAGNTQHPQRAAFIYDDFAHSVGVATESFESGDTDGGGKEMRRAFVKLERTLSPQTRSTFTLRSLFFALAILNQARLFEVSRLLLAHATHLVLLRAQGHHNGSNGRECSRARPSITGTAESCTFQDGGHFSHPFPQILTQLLRLVEALEGDDAAMSRTVFRAWSTYHRVSSAVLATNSTSNYLRREYWHVSMRRNRCPVSFSSNSAHIWMEPILRHLYRLLDIARKDLNEDAVLLHMDEVISVHSILSNESVKNMAMEMLARVESMSSQLAGEAKESYIAQWGYNAGLELGHYYGLKRDFDMTINCMRRIVPESLDPAWQDILEDQLQSWDRDNQEKLQGVDGTSFW